MASRERSLLGDAKRNHLGSHRFAILISRTAWSVDRGHPTEYRSARCSGPARSASRWVIRSGDKIWDHDFVGRDALATQKGSLAKQLVAFSTEGRAIPRPGYIVEAGVSHGTVTSGNFSPSLQHGIGLAYLSPPPDEAVPLTVTIRGATVEAIRVTLPFLDR